MQKTFICPNCGAELLIPPTTNGVTCRHCNTPLLLSSNSKLILAQPSSSYLDETKAKQESKYDSPKFSEERRKRATALTHERLAQEKEALEKGMRAGILTILIGVLFFLVIGIQIYFLGVSAISIMGIFIGGFALVIGFSVIVWFKRAFHSDN